MRTRILLAFCLTSCLVFQSGCNIVDSTEAFFNSRPPDYTDGTETFDEHWTSTAGKEGRGNRARQQDPDSWWGRLIMSRKARDIENNLGIDH